MISKNSGQICFLHQETDGNALESHDVSACVNLIESFAMNKSLNFSSHVYKSLLESFSS